MGVGVAGEDNSFGLRRRSRDEVTATFAFAPSALDGGESWAVVAPVGRIEQRSASFSASIDREVEHLICELVRMAADGHEVEAKKSAEGLRIKMIKLFGAEGVRFLVMCTLAPPSLSLQLELTPRQLEIAEYAAAGATAKEIASVLQISPLTVKTHLRTIYERLSVGNRIELADALNPRRS